MKSLLRVIYILKPCSVRKSALIKFIIYCMQASGGVKVADCIPFFLLSSVLGTLGLCWPGQTNSSTE